MADFDEARTWAARFVHWYNHDHRHSSIRYVSPAQRHAGADRAILDARHALYVQARERNRRRWSGTTRATGRRSTWSRSTRSARSPCPPASRRAPSNSDWLHERGDNYLDACRSATAKAIDSSLGRWVALTRYVDDGSLPADNDWVENRIRPIALGRNNWLFAGSLRSGKRAAAIMSLIHSARLNGHEPHALPEGRDGAASDAAGQPHRRAAAASLASVWRLIRSRSMSSRMPPGRPGPKIIYQLRVELQHLEPRIWRTLLVPDNLTLAKLDHIVQAAMGWTNSHLHEWRIEGRRYGIPDAEWDSEGDVLDERKFKLASVLGGSVAQFEYEYDFGDGWEHQLLVERRFESEPGRSTWPMCIAGANACPPEDVGGPHGYMEFVQAMQDPRHEEHLRMWQWNGGAFDPASFSINNANRLIRRLR